MIPTTELLWNAFDLVLAAVALTLAWAALSSRGDRQGVIFFIAFGLVIALIWARLKAPDVALAEAAIGAGLTGALLLAASSETGTGAETASARAPHWLSGLNPLISALSVALGLAVAWAYLSAFAAAPDLIRLQDLVTGDLQNSGVSNPVTAVLLNFRAYDTLLELTVLVTALSAIVAMAPSRPAYRAPGSLFGGLVIWLVPTLIVTGAYLLWAGSHAPGGAFQAGALFAAIGVLLRLSGRGHAGLPQGTVVRIVTVAGVAVFATVGSLMLALGGAFLQFPPAWAGKLILLIETTAMLSIAAILIIAFVGGRPEGWEYESGAGGGQAP